MRRRPFSWSRRFIGGRHGMGSAAIPVEEQRLAGASRSIGQDGEVRPLLWKTNLAAVKLHRSRGRRGTFLYYGRQFRPPTSRTIRFTLITSIWNCSPNTECGIAAA